MNTTPVTTEELDKFKADLTSFIHGHFDTNYPNNPKPVISISIGKKYAKILSDGSAYGFIEMTTGNIFKAASWNAPAKHSRGNIRDTDLFGVGKVCGPHSIIYLR